VSDRWTGRTGIGYNTAATPDVTVTPLLPEARRWTLTAGAGFRMTDRLSADAGFEYVFQDDRRGRVRPRTRRSQPAEELNVGGYEGNAWILGVTVVYRPGGALPRAPWGAPER